MPHQRPRAVLDIIQKKLKLQPVVALQGARQTGKSFLMREIFTKKNKKSLYLTFDRNETKEFAHRSIGLFLKNVEDYHPVIIDEAQKVPKIFDAVKLSVDENRVPGKFILLGSTEFSKHTLVTESLTGRMSRCRIFPLSILESLFGHIKENKSPTLTQIFKYLERGGLPGIFWVREEGERSQLFEDWLSLTCYRDLDQIKGKKLEGETALNILKQICILPEPTKSEISKALKLDSRIVENHLIALKELFVIYELKPHTSSGGKSIYLPFDCGIAHSLGAGVERKLHIALLNEALIRSHYFEKGLSQFCYYRSLGKKWISLIEEKKDGSLYAYGLHLNEAVSASDLKILNAFQLKNKKSKAILYAPILEKQKQGDVVVMPWTSFLVPQ